MLYTLFFLCLLVLSHIDESYEIVPLLGIGTAFVAVVGVAHVILITVAVARDTAVKKLSAKWVWGILTFIGGLPIACFTQCLLITLVNITTKKAREKILFVPFYLFCCVSFLWLEWFCVSNIAHIMRILISQIILFVSSIQKAKKLYTTKWEMNILFKKNMI
jgi:hypothetical protein